MWTFNDQVKAAERRVATMDEVDGKKERDLRTILLALECGLKSPGTGAHFDAYVMLKDIAK